MVYRAKDICSAAFYNDVQRLRLLATQGVPGGVIDNEEDPLEDAEEEAIDANPEMVNLLAQYELGAASDDDYEGGKNDAAQVDDDVDDEELQQADLALFRRIVRREIREAALARNLNTPGLLQVGTNPVEITPHGVFFSIREDPQGGSGEAGGPSQGESSRDTGEEAVIPLRVSWKPSKRSPLRASPLHWAVLGRSHEAIRLLIELGADARQEIHQDVGFTPDLLPSPTMNHTAERGGCPIRGLTPEELAIANRSDATLKVLRAAVATRSQILERRSEEKQNIEGRLEQRKARREKERLSREQRRMQEEEFEESAYSGNGGSEEPEQYYHT
ncbi:unnamed protein product [Phytomonas sp. EM1]|nr:unnamed protein product [Phytomonas sp. EM1]|eukprot:CCW64438.1 unnamed protein product [Phytomonas sp. isolate EM1]